MMKAEQFPLLDHISSGILAINQDANIVLWNKQMQRWTKISQEQADGKNLFELFPETNARAFRIRIEQVLDGGAPVIFSPQLHHHLIFCPLDNGNPRTQLVTVTWLPAQEMALFNIQDQSEQYKLIENYKWALAEIQSELDRRTLLEKKNARLIAAIDQAGEAVIVISRNGSIEYCNQALFHQTGRDCAEINEISAYEGLFRDPGFDINQHIEEAVQTGKTWVGRQQISREDGSSFTASISIAPIFNEDGYVTHSMIIQEDISQHLAIEEKLRNTQKQEALITLVGGIAHDFNNLLAGLVGQAYLASREVKGMPKTAERLKKIQTISHEASEIVKQLLTFARQGEHHASEFSLGSFIKEFFKLARHSVPESIRFTLDYEQGQYPFRGDANQLQQALLNIVQNAVSACESGKDGLIEIGLHAFNSQENPLLISKYPVLRHGNFVHLTIRDNGFGISADNLERIFDPFFTTKQLGSGMGLAMVMGCIRHHHGIIDVESGSGQGSTFHILLPVIKPRARPESTLQEAPRQSADILLVDDDPRVLEPTEELLESMGHHVTLAHDGQQACDIFQSRIKAWDIVITDMVMPKMNGLEAAQKMRTLRPDIPLIFATGYDQSLVIDNTRKMENSTLISKPFNPDDLDQLISDMVSQ